MKKLLLIPLGISISLVGCSTIPQPIQKVNGGMSHFQGAMYPGETMKISEDLTGAEQYRVFSQGESGFVSQLTVRSGAKDQAIEFCDQKAKKTKILQERRSAAPHILGNFPRSELTFICVDNFDKQARQLDKSEQSRKLAADSAYHRKDYTEAIKLYRSLAAEGFAFAQTGIGLMYHDGKGITRDFQEALKWFHLAAAQGYGEAQYMLGVMYYRGAGVTRDYQEALMWYRLSAAQGVSAAKNAIELPEMIRASKIQTQLIANNSSHSKENIAPPKLTFNSTAPNADGTVELSGHVTSNVGISEISINGRALEAPLASDGSFKVTRLPPMGSTTYLLSVTDELGQRRDATVNIDRAVIQYDEQTMPLDPRKLKARVNQNAIALIIGVESYSRLPPAKYADSDANHFYNYANHSLGVSPNKIKLLTDTKANRADLLLAMRGWIKAEIVLGKSDVYIFFAGHGLSSPDGKKTYLLPADGDRDLLDETSILRDDLIASAKGAKTITMFLDTCYSGGTRTNEVLLADARPIAIVPDMKALPSNVTVLAAASGAQLSSTYEAAQQGLFSYWLMKGLEGDADANQDKKITTGELHEYVAKQVGPMAQRRNRQQDPQLMGDSTRVLVSY